MSVTPDKSHDINIIDDVTALLHCWRHTDELNVHSHILNRHKDGEQILACDLILLLLTVLDVMEATDL